MGGVRHDLAICQAAYDDVVLQRFGRATTSVALCTK